MDVQIPIGVEIITIVIDKVQSISVKTQLFIQG